MLYVKLIINIFESFLFHFIKKHKSRKKLFLMKILMCQNVTRRKNLKSFFLIKCFFNQKDVFL